MHHRKGYTKVPNHIWDDRRLDGTDIALLSWLISHRPGYVVKGPTVRDRLGMAEPKYNSRMRKLVDLGFLQKEAAYINGRVAGIYVNALWPDLSKENARSEQEDFYIAEQPKTVRSNCGLLRRTNNKNSAHTLPSANYGDVIDHRDDG